MRGKRVLIVAPTNNAVEQVLRGVIKTIESNPEAKRYIDINKDIIRMGLATAGFFEDYPKICERKNTAAEVGKLKDEIQLIESLLKERSIEALRPIIDEIINLIHKREEANFISKRGIERNLKSEIGKLKEKLSCYPEFQFLMDQTNEVNISSDIYRIRDRLYNRDVPVLSNQKYAKLSDSQLRDRIDKCNKEIKELKEYQSTARMGSSKIIGMTPHKLMQYSDKFFGDDPSIHIDHVFVDEAGYANMIQMLPIFMIGSPVTFLGDHKQLAPVFQLDKGDVKTWYNRKDSFMHYVSMWAMPAIYSEFALSGDFDKITKSYLNMKEPEFEITDTANLTASHRFGKNLASILDRCIYQNGITGHDGAPLEITIIDAPCEEEGEANLPEVNAIKDYILANKTRLKDFAVLTPYRAQVDALNNSLGKEYSNNIMTIHKSQGREWDTVIISVRDNEFTSKSVRLTFTSTVKNIDGARVINTAVSRAKKNLVIVCDIDFWTNRVDKNQLIRNLIIEAR